MSGGNIPQNATDGESAILFNNACSPSEVVFFFLYFPLLYIDWNLHPAASVQTYPFSSLEPCLPS